MGYSTEGSTPGAPGAPGADGAAGAAGRDSQVPGPPGQDADDPIYIPGRQGADGFSIMGPPGRPGEDADDPIVIPGRNGADGASGASGTVTAFEKDLGTCYRSGTFDITGLSGLTVDKSYDVRQSGAAIASKGNARDESEMDTIVVTAYATDAATLRALWYSANGAVVVGTYAFVSVT